MGLNPRVALDTDLYGISTWQYAIGSKHEGNFKMPSVGFEPEERREPRTLNVRLLQAVSRICRWLPHRDNELSRLRLPMIHTPHARGSHHVCLGPDLIAYLVTLL
jgi:hypothetical protein